jgi:hypothetical protein
MSYWQQSITNPVHIRSTPDALHGSAQDDLLLFLGIIMTPSALSADMRLQLQESTMKARLILRTLL